MDLPHLESNICSQFKKPSQFDPRECLLDLEARNKVNVALIMPAERPTDYMRKVDYRRKRQEKLCSILAWHLKREESQLRRREKLAS